MLKETTDKTDKTSDLLVGMTPEEWKKALSKEKAKACSQYRDIVALAFNIAPSELTDKHYQWFDQKMAFSQLIDAGVIRKDWSTRQMLATLESMRENTTDAQQLRDLALVESFLIDLMSVQSQKQFIHDAKPQSTAEVMLLQQMQLTHKLTEKMLTLAAEQDQTHHLTVISNVALKAGNLFAKQLDLLEKINGRTGQQTVTVQHLHANDGAQVAVGHFEKGGGHGGKTTQSVPCEK